MASTPEAVKEILVTRSADFAGRQRTYSVKERTLGMLVLCIAIQGSLWIPGTGLTGQILFTIPAIFACALGSMGYQQCHVVSQRVIAVEFVYSINRRRPFNTHSKCTVRVSTSFTSLLHTEWTSTVAIASRSLTMNTFTNNLPLASSR